MQYFLFRSIFVFTIALSSTTCSAKSSKQQAFEGLIKAHPYTFFCQTPIAPDHSIQTRACDTCPPLPVKVQKMLIVPSKRLAQGRLCFERPICQHANGKPYKGVACCRKMDMVFKNMEKDLHNLVPEDPKLKAVYQKMTLGKVQQGLTQHACHLLIDNMQKRLTPSPQSAGILARTYLYYHQRYQLILTAEEKQLFIEWDLAYPKTTWEKEREEVIKRLGSS